MDKDSGLPEVQALLRLAKAIQNVPIDESSGEWVHTMTHGEADRATGSNSDFLVRKLRFPYNVSKLQGFAREFGGLGKAIIKYWRHIVWCTWLHDRPV